MLPLIHLFVLSSGSKGNAAVVEGPEGSVLVDCGISFRALARQADVVGCDLSRIRAVVVTHEHGDHIRGLEVLANRLGDLTGIPDVPFYATAGTAAGSTSRSHTRDGLASVPFALLSHDGAFSAGGMLVTAFPTSHDVADPFGLLFRVVDEEGEVQDSLGWCTDTGVLTAEALEALRGTRILGVESNHDEDMLAHGPYPAFLKRRIAGERGHLSNAQCADALPLLVGEDTETVVALHLSEKNNRPTTCVRTLATAVGAQMVSGPGEPPEARTPDGALTVCAASQDQPLAVW